MTSASRWAVTTAAGLITMLAACGSDDLSDLPSPQLREPVPSVVSPAVSLSPNDAAAAEEILAALDAYFEGLIELSKEGVPGGTNETIARLEELPLSGPAFFQLRDEILTANFRQGRATAGTLTWSAEVVEIDWEFSYEQGADDVFPHATLQVRIDETSWTAIDKSTGEVVDGPGSKHLSRITAMWKEPTKEIPIKPGWYIITREDSSEPC